MSRRLRVTVALFSALAINLMLFSNCGKMASQSFDSSSTSTAQNDDHGAPHIQPSASLAPNTDIDFTVMDDEIMPSASYSWSHKLNGVANACQVKSSSISKTYTVNCPQAGNLSVSVSVSEGNQSVPVADYLAILTASPTPTPTPAPGSSAPTPIAMNVTFNIPAGTAKKSWNTAATKVEVFVGQTLTIVNDDTITHQMHTSNTKPAPHGGPIAAGASMKETISNTVDSTTSASVYDHIAGNAARFYIVSYDGAALYTQNCASCHGALASSTKAKSDVPMIKNALATVPAMMGVAALQNLTTRQLEAISYALGNK